jgi:hypothetical protein
MARAHPPEISSPSTVTVSAVIILSPSSEAKAGAADSSESAAKAAISIPDVLIVSIPIRFPLHRDSGA